MWNSGDQSGGMTASVQGRTLGGCVCVGGGGGGVSLPIFSKSVQNVPPKTHLKRLKKLYYSNVNQTSSSLILLIFLSFSVKFQNKFAAQNAGNGISGVQISKYSRKCILPFATGLTVKMSFQKYPYSIGFIWEKSNIHLC